MAVTPSLFPLFLKAKSGDIVILGSAVDAVIQGALAVTLEDELEVGYEEPLTVEVTEEIIIKVDVCDG